MYAVYTKRTLVGFLICLFLFCGCFTLTIAAAGGESETAASAPVESEVVPSETPSTPSEASVVSTPESEAVSSQVVSSQVVSSQTATSEVSSNTPASTVTSTASVASKAVVEAVSEGGAPDDDVKYTSQYDKNGSYIYEGSYTGLASNSTQEEEGKADKPKTSRSDRYATYAKVGMIIFGLLSCGFLVALIIFNRKVAASKKAHPEWYPAKQKEAKPVKEKPVKEKAVKEKPGAPKH